jgi:hypothetical protein
MKNILIIFLSLFSNSLAIAQKSEIKSPKTTIESINGTYILEAVDNILADGSRIHLYGDKPQGMLMFDSKGNYTLQIMSSGRPKFASGDKSKGTDEENRAAIKGCNAHFGTYTIDDTTHTITFNITHASFPNWEGVQQKRPFTLIGNIFTYAVPSPTTGGAVTGEVVWKRVE